MSRRDTDTAKQLEKLGWYIHRRGKHNQWRCPCGLHSMSVSVSPSARSGSDAAIGLAKRLCKAGVHR